MKQSVINELSTAEVKEKFLESKKALETMKLGHAVTPLANPMEIRKQRRTVARLATELTKRERQK